MDTNGLLMGGKLDQCFSKLSSVPGEPRFLSLSGKYLLVQRWILLPIVVCLMCLLEIVKHFSVIVS